MHSSQAGIMSFRNQFVCKSCRVVRVNNRFQVVHTHQDDCRFAEKRVA